MTVDTAPAQLPSPPRPKATRYWRPVLAWLAVAPVAVWTLLRLTGTGNEFPLIQLLAFTVYLFPVALAVAVLTGVLRRWVALAVAVACAVALGVVIGPRALGGPDPQASGPTLHILSANMEFGSSDPANLVNLVREHDVDVLALQEFTPQAQRRLRAAGLEALLPNDALYPAPYTPGGSALYSRYPLTGTGYRQLPTPFGQAYGVLHLPDGQSVRIESAHPPAPAQAGEAGIWRAGQAMEPPASAVAGPQILVGDFNATLDHGPLRALLGTGYVDVASHLGDGLTPTWPFDGRAVPRVTIDHVLVAQLRVYAFATFPNPGSDHRVIYAELGLTGG